MNMNKEIRKELRVMKSIRRAEETSFAKFQRRQNREFEREQRALTKRLARLDRRASILIGRMS